MIIGLGSDLCNIERIQNSLDRFGERFENRVFTEIERAKARRAHHEARLEGAHASAETLRARVREKDVALAEARAALVGKEVDAAVRKATHAQALRRVEVARDAAVEPVVIPQRTVVD